jgi:tRNA G10  N-methylase Trm11
MKSADHSRLGGFMSIFVSTFISGLQEPVEAFLKEDLPGVKILNTYDGLIVYKADADQQKINSLRLFNNTFLLLKQYANCKTDSLEWMIREAFKIRDLGKRLSEYRLPPDSRQFRIITSKENQLTPVSKDVLSQMEQMIAKAANLKINRAKPDLEFWFLYRSERVGFFMLRLTKHTSYEKVLQKGELRPELSHILCRLSEPGPLDIFLDPFCGYGAIPFERAFLQRYNMIFLSDKNEEQVKFCKEKARDLEKKFHKKLIVRQSDALQLSNYEDGFIDRIVTDPPWGMYKEMHLDIGDFYSSMLKELSRVLKPGGFLVLLTAQKDAFENAVKGCRDQLDVLNQYNILVSGKKASIYKIRRV